MFTICMIYSLKTLFSEALYIMYHNIKKNVSSVTVFIYEIADFV